MEAVRTGERERDLAHLLTLVERRVVSRLAAVLAAAGHSVDEWRVLSLLADGHGHAMTEIAEHALLPPPTLTKLIDRMVAANLVHRRVDSADRRRVLVFLTPHGRERHAGLAAVVDGESDRLAAAVGPEEAALLGALLTRIAGRLT
ncbi:MarR family winged helix-turn-helix transcriptional regulator [Actinomadura roseirufa]|uniref:MarR family winged helix-turn-helix transcriptional regulator n=1 Tax=Actinomadura roseirufa TaxID=2094049 RepID=UPI0010415BBA|nr:MarR family transcriptional regulator [Actinomadura roseirufa]